MILIGYILAWLFIIFYIIYWIFYYFWKKHRNKTIIKNK